MPDPTSTHGTVTLHHGECLSVLASMPDASIDAVVTDPPYGLEFMGKGWDGADGFRRSLNPADTGRENAFGRASRTSPQYRAGHLFQEWCTRWTVECLRVLKPGGHMAAFGGSRTWHRLAAAVEDAGFEVRDTIAWLYGSGFPKSRNLDGDWQGWGTALKPAFEPIVLARKPLAGTVAGTVLTHGTGALNIDACRTSTTDTLTGSGSPPLRYGGQNSRPFHEGAEPRGVNQHAAGRWPTNVVLDGHQADELDQQSGQRPAGGKVTGNQDSRTGESGIYGTYGAVENTPYGDTGGASRFFPVFRYAAKAGADERPRVDGIAHPTVKPLDLMRWLVRLITPPGGTVLDPFAGSGTTLEAALIEGHPAVGIEREGDYLPLIAARLNRRRDPVAYLTGQGDDLGLFDLEEGA